MCIRDSVKAILLIPDITHDCLTNTASNQPHLLCLLVTVPNSFPFFPIFFPVSFFNSVGKGPSPTLVVYALTIPRTWSSVSGLHPDPENKDPATVFEEVTNGYVQ